MLTLNRGDKVSFLVAQRCGRVTRFIPMHGEVQLIDGTTAMVLANDGLTHPVHVDLIQAPAAEPTGGIHE